MNQRCIWGNTFCKKAYGAAKKKKVRKKGNKISGVWCTVEKSFFKKMDLDGF